MFQATLFILSCQDIEDKHCPFESLDLEWLCYPYIFQLADAVL